MAKPVLRTVSENVELGEDFVAEAQQEAQQQATQPSVRSLIADTGKALRSAVDRLRKKEASIEEAKSAATARYDRTVALAKLQRDEVFEVADAELHQLRTTLGIIDPARAKLAETA